VAKKKPPTAKKSRPASRSAPARKPAPSSRTSQPRKPAAASPPATKPAAKSSAKPAPEPAKPVRKGITIVTPKPTKPAKPSKRSLPDFPVGSRQLHRPGMPSIKPLIPSGPNAKPGMTLPGRASDASKPAKSPFSKKELAEFRAILERKRAELIGDVSAMEGEALKGSSGSLSHLPQHMAEQGSEAYDQALSLDLAAADRKLIKEIEDALTRIREGTFGICELTGQPISPERLSELPWTRYSIEAARALERGAVRP